MEETRIKQRRRRAEVKDEENSGERKQKTSINKRADAK
jgi:hypothetical protein